MNEAIVEVLVAAGAAIQTVNLFLAGYLLKRTDSLQQDLIIHERDCKLKGTR